MEFDPFTLLAFITETDTRLPLYSSKHSSNRPWTVNLSSGLMILRICIGVGVLVCVCVQRDLITATLEGFLFTHFVVLLSCLTISSHWSLEIAFLNYYAGRIHALQPLRYEISRQSYLILSANYDCGLMWGMGRGETVGPFIHHREQASLFPTHLDDK